LIYALSFSPARKRVDVTAGVWLRSVVDGSF
jgi:hypothetical protein